MTYIWEHNAWPDFTWDIEILAPLLARIRNEQGKLLGNMEKIGFPLQENALLRSLTDEIQKTSEIEGEKFATESVRSSVARRLGIDIGGLLPPDRYVDGIVEVVLDATRNYNIPLSKERLFTWHASLFPTGRSGIAKISTGNFRDDRDGPMRVISGSMGKEKIHYQAPPAFRISQDMTVFLDWFNTPDSSLDPVIKSAVAHFYFVSIHPFDDGNGRIARAIADMELARADGSPDRFYSISAEIRKERSAYYEILETAQKGDMKITGWVRWYLECVGSAVRTARENLGEVTRKTDEWERFRKIELNERQRKMIRRLLDGFEGKLTSSKWAILCKCSQDTAGRDIAGLVNAGILRKSESGGRSTSYEIVNSLDNRII